ncbi:MAG: transporter [Xanthomonadales bacterium]|nr:transporter [Gammaproteobacteria bacterium]NNK05268.1 transporter [Xanthomonadales bacterium]
MPGKPLFILLLIFFGYSEAVIAQDLEPRRWSHLPSGLNMVGMGYAYTEADIYFSPFWKIENGDARLNNLGLTAIHSFDLAGKSARISLLLPYVTGRWSGDVDGEFRVVHRRGTGDPRLRLSVNLYGAPALSGAEFAQYREAHRNSTVVGASLAVTLPLGEYIEDRLINIGGNRWSVRPQIGVVHTRGPWSFELTGSAFLFSNNNKFIDNTVFKQKPVYAVQTHVVHSFERGFWASISTGYGIGGQVTVDQTKTTFEVDNWLWAASVGLPVGKSHSVKLAWVSGRTQNLVGRDSDNLVLSWSTRWSP